MPPRLKQVIGHAKFNCPMGVVAAAAVAVVIVAAAVAVAAVAVALVVAVVEVFIMARNYGQNIEISLNQCHVNIHPFYTKYIPVMYNERCSMQPYASK